MSIEEQRELMNKWFNGECVIEIKTKEECDRFYNFIRMYDLRFIDKKHSNTKFPTYFVWRFCDSLHHHQLEHTTIKNYFKGDLILLKMVDDFIKQGENFSNFHYDGMGEFYRLFNSLEKNNNMEK